MDNELALNIMNSAISLGSSVVTGIIQVLFTAFFTNRNTSKQELEKIKAKKFGEVMDDMLDSGKMTYLEYYKCNNFLKIAKIADEKRENYSQDNSYKKYDFDWFARFYEEASKVSNKEMQQLWANVLSREIDSPNSVSPSLLNSLSIMLKEQALFFCNLSQFVFMDASYVTPYILLFVSTNREAFKDSDITPSKLKVMERLGLIECDFNNEYIIEDKIEFRKGNYRIEVFGDSENRNKIKCGNVKFTRDGEVLYSIIDDFYKKYDHNIFDFIISKFKSRNCRVIVNNQII